MATTLELVNTEQPYTFKSLGIYNEKEETYDASTLFPIGTVVELTEGTFPIASFKDAYEHSKQTHTLGGKQVRLIGNDIACHADELNKYGNCKIKVEAHSTAGGRRNRRNRRTNRARRNRNRFSRRK
jgi:hypothetical protein